MIPLILGAAEVILRGSYIPEHRSFFSKPKRDGYHSAAQLQVPIFPLMKSSGIFFIFHLYESHT